MQYPQWQLKKLQCKKKNGKSWNAIDVDKKPSTLFFKKTVHDWLEHTMRLFWTSTYVVVGDYIYLPWRTVVGDISKENVSSMEFCVKTHRSLSLSCPISGAMKSGGIGRLLISPPHKYQSEKASFIRAYQLPIAYLYYFNKQWMDSGAAGTNGRPAQKHAAKENKWELATAQIQHHVTGESNVLGMLSRNRIAMTFHAQVICRKGKGKRSLLSWHR